MKLSHHHYGKARVRVMKVLRTGAQHQLKELDVSVMLQGDFEACYTRADNHLVVPTDTMKNTVYIVAKESLGSENEEFGLILADHFLHTYPQVTEAEISLSERRWVRMHIESKPHPHSFIQSEQARPFAKITCSRGAQRIESGLEDLLILKSTGSGFEGFVKDKFTTLPETNDRVFATSLKAVWTYERAPTKFSVANSSLLQAMMEVFAENYSPSVQATLFQMGEAALKAVPEISKVTLAMPNKHYLLANLAPLGLENRNEVFVPTNEPHGQIEGTVTR